MNTTSNASGATYLYIAVSQPNGLRTPEQLTCPKAGSLLRVNSIEVHTHPHRKVSRR